MNWNRIAIVGTAGSWVQTPWDDPNLLVVSLNDAYRLPGFKRADAWYDFHPLNRFHHPPDGQPVFAHTVPHGYYVRPKEHLQWLGSQTIPVFLHPQYLEQHAEAQAWRHARAFPKAAVEEYFGYPPTSVEKLYSTSSPAWMLAQAIIEGAKEVHVYGIHLATEHEYIEQRPNFESLLGRVLGRGKQTTRVADGKRYYETQDGLVVLPEASPIFQSDFQYAFEPRPRALRDPLAWDVHRFGIKRARAVQALIDRKWYQRRGPLQDELATWDAHLADAQDALTRLDTAGNWA